MSLDCAPPPQLCRAQNCPYDEALRPSQEAVRQMRVEISLDKEKKIYHPGDTITGTFRISPLPKQATKQTISFNDVEIRFENKVHTSFTNQSKGASNHRVNFMMDDSPILEDTVRCDSVREYKFGFILPESLLENSNCLNPGHHSKLIPSFGAPQLSAVSFGAREVPGLSKTVSQAYEILRHSTTFANFTNYYVITCKVSQLITNQKPLVLFTRSKEIIVHPGVSKLPPGFAESSDNDSSITYYTDELVKSINLKCPDGITKGGVTVSAVLPDPVEELKGFAFPLQIKYKSSASGAVIFPKISYSLRLSQYVIQSKGCSIPEQTLSQFPEEFDVDKDGSSIYKKVQTFFETGIAPINFPNNWIPDYTDRNTFNNQFLIEVPKLSAYYNELLKSTFHSCHLQNLYSLHVSLEFRYIREDEKVVKEDRKWGMIFKRKAIHGDRKSSVRNCMQLDIPVVIH